MKEEKKFELKKVNLLLMGISFVLVVLGFVIMSGVESGDVYNPEIFAARHITVGPMVSFAGFVMMIFSILYQKKDKR